MLNMAATNNKVEAMRLLIAGGADIHAPDKARARCKSPHMISIDGLRLQQLFSSCKHNTNSREDLKTTRNSQKVMRRRVFTRKSYGTTGHCAAAARAQVAA